MAEAGINTSACLIQLLGVLELCFFKILSVSYVEFLKKWIIKKKNGEEHGRL